MKIIRILSLSIIIVSIGLFVFASLVLSSSSQAFPWYIGVASAMFILGLGYFMESFALFIAQRKVQRCAKEENNLIGVKEKAGYLVSKIMSILLCIYLYLLTMLEANLMIQMLCITLVLVQYILELSLQIYFARHKDRRKY